MVAKTRKTSIRSLYLWHRYIGVSAAVLVVILSITGILLNHTDSLRLASRYVTSELLLTWYGVKAPEGLRNYMTDDIQVSQVAQQIYIDANPIPGAFKTLRGVVRKQGILILAVDDAVYLLTVEGILIDRLPLPKHANATVDKLGIDALSNIVVQANTSTFFLDEQMTGWQTDATVNNRLHWSLRKVPPALVKDKISQQYRNQVLDVERVLLDIHSGRILGMWGVYLMDAAAIALILLAFSGIYLWLQQKIKRNKHKKKYKKI